MKIARLYADADGESHWDDVEVDFTWQDFAPPAPPLGVTQFVSAKTVGFIQGEVGWVGDWHPAPQRVLAVYLSGELEIEASDGEVRPIGPGTILLAEDTAGKGHRNRVTSSTELEMVFVTLPDRKGPQPRHA